MSDKIDKSGPGDKLQEGLPSQNLQKKKLI